MDLFSKSQVLNGTHGSTGQQTLSLLPVLRPPKAEWSEIGVKSQYFHSSPYFGSISWKRVAGSHPLAREKFQEKPGTSRCPPRGFGWQVGMEEIFHIYHLPGSPGHGHKSALKIQSWGKRLGIYCAPNAAGLSFNAAALCISLPPTLFISCLLAQPPLIYVFITLINAPAPLTSLFRRSFPSVFPKPSVLNNPRI